MIPPIAVRRRLSRPASGVWRSTLWYPLIAHRLTQALGGQLNSGTVAVYSQSDLEYAWHVTVSNTGAVPPRQLTIIGRRCHRPGDGLVIKLHPDGTSPSDMTARLADWSVFQPPQHPVPGEVAVVSWRPHHGETVETVVAARRPLIDSLSHRIISTIQAVSA